MNLTNLAGKNVGKNDQKRDINDYGSSCAIQLCITPLGWGLCHIKANGKLIARTYHSKPFRGHYSGHMITLSQSEASNQVTWSLSANQKLVSRSHDRSLSIRSQCPGHMITLSQSEDSIQVTWSLSTYQSTVSLVSVWFRSPINYVQRFKQKV